MSWQLPQFSNSIRVYIYTYISSIFQTFENEILKAAVLTNMLSQHVCIIDMYYLGWIDHPIMTSIKIASILYSCSYCITVAGYVHFKSLMSLYTLPLINHNMLITGFSLSVIPNVYYNMYAEWVSGQHCYFFTLVNHIQAITRKTILDLIPEILIFQIFVGWLKD